MWRIRHQREAEEMAAALTWMPPALQEVLDPERGLLHLFVGDPEFAGLEFGELANEEPVNSAPHMSYPWNNTAGDPTIIIPRPEWVRWDVLVHEIGHWVHFVLNFEDFDLPNVSEYAETNLHECFAEAFVAYVFSPAERYAEEQFGLDYLSRDDMRWFDYHVSYDD